MIVVTPKDAYALALMARQPERNGDLLSNLSPMAQPIGSALLTGEPVQETDPEVAEVVRRLQEWARNEPNRAGAPAPSPAA